MNNPAPESQVNWPPAAKPLLPRASRGASFKLLGTVATSLLLLAHAADVLAQELGAPPLVIRSNTQESTIWAQDRAGAPAPNGTQTIQSTNGAGAATGTVNATGANTVLSTTQVVQPSSILIQGDLPCESTTKTWTVAAQSCEATLPRTFSGFTASGTDSTQPTTGQAEFACSGGTFAASPGPGATCVLATCPTEVKSWVVGGATCSASVAGVSSGQTRSVASANGNTGTATFACNINT